jgi:hypothetical protein
LSSTCTQRRHGNRFTEHARQWHDQAGQLADWALRRLANRTDAWGKYLPCAARRLRRTAITARGQLTRDVLVRHFQAADVGDVVGLHSTAADGTCRWIALDVDQHQADGFDERKRLNGQATMLLQDRLTAIGFKPLLLGSNGRGGYHVWVIFTHPVASRVAFSFAQWLIRDWKELGLASRPETFPRQPQLTDGVRLGNWLRLPGRHHTLSYFSQVWDGTRWLAGAAAIERITTITGDTPANIPGEALNYGGPSSDRAGVTSGRPSLPEDEWTWPPIDRVLARLAGVSGGSNQLYARCPAHKDRKNSLSVREADDGRVLLYCHAGCRLEEIVFRLGLSVSELFAASRSAVRTRRGPIASAIRTQPAPRRCP